jgi:hypothetical protein
MGKAVEHLVAATCIIQSRARLNVSTSLVDDEGVDLVFHRRGGTDTLAVQVKARFNDSKALASGTFLQNVRSETMKPRGDFDVLFVAVDVASGSFDVCWLVPSADLATKGMRDSLGRYRFAASVKPGSHDKWTPYRLSRAQLPGRILSRLGS